MANNGNGSPPFLGRPDERELLAEVLSELDDLPPGLGERLEALLDADDRADAIRALFEELSAE